MSFRIRRIGWGHFRQNIHFTVELPGGETITICDTPGFGDTKGTEVEIANGLGIIHALKLAASVKPVLVINHPGMHDSRYARYHH